MTGGPGSDLACGCLGWDGSSWQGPDASGWWQSDNGPGAVNKVIAYCDDNCDSGIETYTVYVRVAWTAGAVCGLSDAWHLAISLGTCE